MAPGFINMLSWATESLIEDGAAQSDLRQGVTLEVFGEGDSMGPLTDTMRADMVRFQGDIRYDVPWTTLGEYLEYLQEKGVAVNVASFVGATTVRVHELGYADRAPTPEELARMQDLVRDAMREGALGVGSSLIYAPAFYAQTAELIALMQAAAEFDGMYISHMRSEGNRLLESVDELIRIARESGAPAEIYHLKAAGRVELREDGYGHPEGGGRPGRRRAHHGGHVHLHGGRHRARRGHAALGAGGRATTRGRPGWRIPPSAGRVAREMITPTDEWENLAAARPARPSRCCSWASAPTRSNI